MYLLRRAWANVKNEILVLPSRVLVALWLLGLVLLPVVWPDPYILRIVTMTCLFAIFAASWDLLAGFAGQVSFGHALNFGVGAYASALLATHLGMSPWITVWLGALVALLIGVATGWLCLRLRGAYLSLATLALPIILVGILFAFPKFSGGELGISGLRRLATSPEGNYAIATISMLVSVFAMWLIADSKFGLVLHAIRDDEVAARASGINTTRYKLAVFALSALFAGVSGALYSHFLRVAGPSTLEVALSFQAVIWGIFGGAATIYGPVAAVFLLYPFTEWLGNFERLSEMRQLIFAVTVLVILLFMPRGMVPWVRDKIESTCPRCKARNGAWRRECRLCGAGLRGALGAADRAS